MPEAREVATPAVATALEVAGVPPRFRDRTLAGFERRTGTAKALDAARRLAGDEAPTGGLVLLGPPGVGKTHLSVGILADRAARWLRDHPAELREEAGTLIVRPPFRSRFASVPALLDELREAAQLPGAADPLQPLKSAPLLVLDDLGREKATEWAVERLYVLIDRRYADLLPTVATTNFDLDELADRGYEAMLSRLLEGSTAIRLGATDYRVGVGR
jgi:DNA replication protein DnaC